MKKVLLFLFFFFLTVCLGNLSQVLAAPGDGCRSQGGTCRQLLCNPEETFIGYLDCPEYVDVNGTYQQEMCCKFVGGNCIPDGGTCTPGGSRLCCSGICEYDNHTGLNICKTQQILPTSPAGKINIHGPCPTDKIHTALGCVPVGKGRSTEDFIVWFLQRLIGVSGGIAFLLTIFGGFKILTSAGNPKGVQAGREIITSALIGLLFIIFSLFLLELIGVKILGIPGF